MSSPPEESSTTSPDAPDAPAGKPRSRLRKWTVRLCKLAVVAVLLLLVTLVAVSELIDWYCIAQPPARPTEAIQQEVVADVDGVRSIGDGQLGRRDGVMWMSLQGDPYTLGYMNASLSGPWISQQETELFGFLTEQAPAWWQQFLLWKVAQVYTRNLPDYVSLDEQLEVLGLVDGHEDPHPGLAFWAPLYHRVLNYHAAHDLSHTFMDSPLVKSDRFLAGCTSFAAWGEATADGHLWIGRNFDFGAARAFDLNKIVMRVEQTGKIGYVHVGWPGMAGAVTGVNDERIVVALNGVRSELKAKIGTPVCFVIQRVLQNAHTLDEAVQIIRDAQVFVSDLYLVADGKTGVAVVVEKTPEKCEVRKPAAGEDVLVVSNHFMTQPLVDDAKNRALMADGTTVPRYDRMLQLVQRERGHIDAARAAEILRNRQGVDDRPLGPGNEASVNPLIATHSVIFDATAGVLWVAASPHQLGNYVPFNVLDVRATPDLPVLPADELMQDGGYERLRLWRQKLKAGQIAWRNGDDQEARSLLREAAALNPQDYQAKMMLGKIAFDAGDPPAARALLEDALSLYPAFAPERRAIEQMLKQLPPTEDHQGD